MRLRLSSEPAHRRRQLAALLALVFFLVAGVALSAFGGSQASDDVSVNPQQSSSREIEQVEIVRVVDGDTVVVERLDGSEEKVRLIGIDAPESVASDESRNTEEGRIASAYLHELLPARTVVYLEQDVSDRDQYDRLLRYVWLDEPDGALDHHAAAEVMVNAILVGEGYARAKSYAPDTAYDKVLRELGKEAAREKRGVSQAWS
ncbi:thermonuclease family protein [Raoultibacter phocaeensis]|uniref:thermonuclease family protein n=1 Tax=Raoultibacter phocaeensis TaxID=2479841 RepID=UPI001118DF9D|nr:thermonuclease family protein [Raoultibacter phocaeensis]